MVRHFLGQLMSLEMLETNQCIDQYLQYTNQRYFHHLIHSSKTHHYQTRYLEYPIKAFFTSICNNIEILIFNIHVL